MNKKIKLGIGTLLLLVLSFNVFGLSFNLDVGGTGTLPTCSNGEFLLYTGGAWSCETFTTGSGLTLTCADGEIITYNTTSSDWECAAYPVATGGSFDLTCSVGQTTTYNGTDWVCADVVVDTNTNIDTLYMCDNGEILEYSTINGWECGTDSTGTDDQTLEEVLTQGNSANGLNIYDVNNFNLTGTFRQGEDGNMFIYDIENELHHVNVDLERFDELRTNTFTTDLEIETFYNATGQYINITATDSTRISFISVFGGNHISESFSTNNYILPLINGSNQTPILNRVYAIINASQEPEWVVSITEPTIPHAMASRIYVGAVNSEPYASNLQEDGDDTFLKNVQRRFRKEGLLYNSGLNFTGTQTNLLIDEGHFINGIYDKTINDLLNTSDGFFLIREDGAFRRYTSFDEINQYSDGGTIGSVKYFNVVFGVVPYDGSANIYAVVQTEPSVEYTSTNVAYADSSNTLKVYPNDNFLKTMFLPIARMIINENGNAQILPNGFYAEDYRGGIAGGISSGGGLTEVDPVWTSEKPNYYTSIQTDSLLDNYYNKTEINNNFSNYYTKSEVNSTYLYDKSCNDGENLAFNSTSDSWDCVNITASIPENISLNTLNVTNINLEYTTINSTNETIIVNSPDNSLITYNSLMDSLTLGVNDQSGNNNDLTNNGATYDSGSDSFDFDGTNDYSLSPNLGISGDNDITISFWATLDNLITNRVAISKGTSTGGTSFQFRVESGSIYFDGTSLEYKFDSGLDITDNNFHHYVMLYDSSLHEISIFMDGVEGNVDTVTLNQADEEMAIGSIYLNNGATQGLYWDGKISGVSVFNRTLSSTEISTLYTEGRLNNISDSSVMYESSSNIEITAYFKDKVSATGYITRTPKDKNVVNHIKDYMNNLPETYIDSDGKLTEESLFEIEKTPFGSYLIDAVAFINRAWLIELTKDYIDTKLKVKELETELENTKTIANNRFNEICSVQPSFSWC